MGEENHKIIINNRFALESFGRGLQSLHVTSSKGSIVLVSASLRNGLETLWDEMRLQLMALLCNGSRSRVFGAVNEVGLVLAARGKKNDDCCILAG
jgi:hypothetical protein